MNIKVGQELPNFIGKAFDGKEINLAQFQGDQNLVLYFYPKDDTPGCTVEGIDFSQLNKDFAKSHTKVIGMSRDDSASHERFCHKNNLSIPLLSDEAGSYGQKLGLLKESGSYFRTTLLVGRDGKIKYIWEAVKASGHAAEVLGKVREFENMTQKKLAVGKDLGSTKRAYQKPAQRAVSKSRFRNR